MESSSEFIPTKSALLKRDCVKSFECVVYKSHKPAGTKISSSSSSKIERNRHEMDIEKVRHEVVKFSVAGMNPEEKREATKNLLLKLGAKPPRKPYINYKTILEQKKKEKEEPTHLPDDPMKDMFEKKKNKKGRTRNEKRKNNILEAYGKPGQVGKQKKKRRK